MGDVREIETYLSSSILYVKHSVYRAKPIQGSEKSVPTANGSRGMKRILGGS